VAAVTCADANTAATAAIIRGRQALPWLASLRLPARLVAQDGTIHALNAWPDEENRGFLPPLQGENHGLS
jgi:FAD:protein FMN transferase